MNVGTIGKYHPIAEKTFETGHLQYIYRFSNGNGVSVIYNPDGKNVEMAFLRFWGQGSFDYLVDGTNQTPFNGIVKVPSEKIEDYLELVKK